MAHALTVQVSGRRDLLLQLKRPESTDALSKPASLGMRTPIVNRFIYILATTTVVYTSVEALFWFDFIVVKIDLYCDVTFVGCALNLLLLR